MERIISKSNILAENEVFGGSPDFYKTYQNYTRNATITDIKNAAGEWLKDGEFILKILPYEDYSTSAVKLDRTKMPDVTTANAMKFPAIKNIKLSNGTNVYLIERHETPLVNLSVLFDFGYETDALSKAGTNRLMTDLLLMGTTTKSAEQINDRLNELGADLTAVCSIDGTGMVLNALKENFAASVNLLSDVLINANFPMAEFDRLKKDQLLSIEQEKANPNALASRLLPQLLFTNKVVQGLPASGTGYKETVSSITREDVVNDYNKYFGAKNASIIVVGDVTESELKNVLENNLAKWRQGEIPKKTIPAITIPKTPTIYFVDMPAAQQSVIRVSKLNDVSNDMQKNEAMKLMNTLLGGSFLSRLNMNLREDKHWSYGAGSGFRELKNENQFVVSTSVQTDKTKESLQEILKELNMINSTKPVSENEFSQQRSATLMELAGDYETNGDLRDKLENVIFYKKGDAYLNNISNAIQQLTLPEIQAAAGQYITPQNFTWLIIGDKAKVLQGIKDLKWGEVIELNKDGEVVK